MSDRVYIAIDLKSFYASSECADRHLDPLSTNLVVADTTRTEKTICLAVSPSLKSKGVPGRPRLFEVIQKVNEINEERLRLLRYKLKNPDANFTGESFDANALESDPSLKLSYIVAPPRMARYVEVSTQIYEIYTKYVSPEDIIVYSIDEVFIDATPYLKNYRMSPRELGMTIVRQVLYTTGITATAGIGTNLYLAKVAMDIVAKHVPADSDGVRMAELDEMSYRRILWGHRPLTDFWRIGRGIARKLEANGMFTMGDIARMSLDNAGENLLYRLFGINAELIIDHAWGWEPCTIDVIKKYRPRNNSLSSGQVLHRPYEYDEGAIIVREMADALAYDMIEKGIVTDSIGLTIGYDRESLAGDRGKEYTGKVSYDGYGRAIPESTGGMVRLKDYLMGKSFTSSVRLITKAALDIYQSTTYPYLLVRRVTIVAGNVIPETAAEKSESYSYDQLDLFSRDEGYFALSDEFNKELDRERKLSGAVVSIKQKYGKNALLKGTSYLDGSRAKERNGEIGGHRA